MIAELDGNEDEPWELENKAILPLLFGEKTPYGHPIIGERKHVRAATAAIIKSHYDKWYHPNNACIVLVGGIDAAVAMARIRELFGSIPAGKLPPRNSVTPVHRDKPIYKEFPSKFEADRLLIGFNTCKMGDPDDYVLDVIQHILTTGKTGRLYRELVLGQEVAGEATCANQIGRYPGWFSIELEVMKGVDRKKAEQALLNQLEILARSGFGRRVEARAAERARRPDLPARGPACAGRQHCQCRRHHRPELPAELSQSNPGGDARRRAARRPEILQSESARGGLLGRGKDRGKEIAGARRQKTGPRKREPERELAVGATGGVDLKRTKRVVLENGLTLLLLERHRLPIVYAEALVRRTRLYESKEKAGVAALVGLMLEEATERHNEKEISRAIENVGGVLTMSSSGGQVKVLSPDRHLGLSLLLECLTKPAFQRDDLKRLKENMWSELQDEKSQASTRAQNEFLKQIYGDHPLGRSANGDDDTVDALTCADCRKFHEQVFVPNNTILAIVGDFDSAAIIKDVTAMTRDWKKRELPKLNLPAIHQPQKLHETIISMPAATQLNIYLGHPGIRRDDPDYYKLLVMDNILGIGSGFTDRLSSKLRDRNGWAYTVSASITTNAGDDVGVFTGYIATYPDKLEIVKKGMIAEIERMRTEKPSAQEVADTKGYLLGTLPFRLVTNGDLAGQLLYIERHGLGLDYLAFLRKTIESVTPDDVLAVAKKHLHPDRMILVAAGPVNSKGQPLKKDQ